MKAKTKRYISLFLALVFCFSLLGTFPAFAATTVQAYMVNYPRQNDPNYGGSRFGHSANYLMSGWAYVAYERMTLHAIGSYNGQIAYCIEPGVDQDSGDTLTSTDESYWDNYPASSNVTIPPETIKTLLGRVLTYGYHGNISQNWMTGNASDADSLSYAIATQMPPGRRRSPATFRWAATMCRSTPRTATTYSVTSATPSSSHTPVRTRRL